MAQFKVEYQEIYNHEIEVDASSYIDAEEKAAQMIRENPYNFLKNNGDAEWNLSAIGRKEQSLPSLNRLRAARDQISFAA